MWKNLSYVLQHTKMYILKVAIIFTHFTSEKKLRINVSCQIFSAVNKQGPILDTDFKGSQFSKIVFSKFRNLGVARVRGTWVCAYPKCPNKKFNMIQHLVMWHS